MMMMMLLLLPSLLLELVLHNSDLIVRSLHKPIRHLHRNANKKKFSKPTTHTSHQTNETMHTKTQQFGSNLSEIPIENPNKLKM
jgi:hypothetical protein